ncbi:hypothetical protein [Streptomyces sp. NPDC004728]|uniref:hypothetical protein n=1 Tax=Streptomyces sp. NPDC004728 TaxID=3154289 RepID=UPI0033B76AAF
MERDSGEEAAAYTCSSEERALIRELFGPQLIGSPETVRKPCGQWPALAPGRAGFLRRPGHGVGQCVEVGGRYVRPDLPRLLCPLE